MNNWIILSIGLIISSSILYLLIRKGNDIFLSVTMQNMAMFLLPSIFFGFYNFLNDTSFYLSFSNLMIVALAALFFSWFGNYSSLKSIKLSTNPAFSLIISKSYVIITTILSIWLFNSNITIKSAISIILIVLFSSLILVNKKRKSNKNNKWLVYSILAFLSWGFLALTLKYLIDDNLEPTIILFYLMTFVSFVIAVKHLLKNEPLFVGNSSLFLFFLIGVFSTLFNIFTILGYKYAPNPGYINAANASSVAFVMVGAHYLFGDELTKRKAIGLIGVIVSLIILFV